MPSPDLSTTHHALLCLLSTGPASAYELVQQAQRSIGHVWPRAESNLYAALQRLASEGLAEASGEMVGRRPRTTYTITGRGLRELTTWLSTPGDAPVFESEALLKLGFAPSSTKEAALSQVAVVAEDAAGRLAFGRALAEATLAGQGPPPERLHISVVLWRYLWEMHAARVRWADWARSEIESWPHTGDRPEGRERALATWRDVLAGEGSDA